MNITGGISHTNTGNEARREETNREYLTMCTGPRAVLSVQDQGQTTRHRRANERQRLRITNAKLCSCSALETNKMDGAGAHAQLQISETVQGKMLQEEQLPSLRWDKNKVVVAVA